MQQAFARLRLGAPGRLPRPVDRIEDELAPDVLAAVDHALRCSAWGSEATVRDQLAALIAPLRPDEVIVNGNIHDLDARVASFEIAAGILRRM